MESGSTQVTVEHKRNPISKVVAFNRWKATVLSTKKVFLEFDTQLYISEIGYMEEIPIMVVDMIKNIGDNPTWHPVM